jgi:hypothetical protein
MYDKKCNCSIFCRRQFSARTSVKVRAQSGPRGVQRDFAIPGVVRQSKTLRSVSFAGFNNPIFAQKNFASKLAVGGVSSADAKKPGDVPLSKMELNR